MELLKGSDESGELRRDRSLSGKVVAVVKTTGIAPYVRSSKNNGHKAHGCKAKSPEPSSFPATSTTLQ